MSLTLTKTKSVELGDNDDRSGHPELTGVMRPELTGDPVESRQSSLKPRLSRVMAQTQDHGVFKDRSTLCFNRCVGKAG